MKYWYKDKQIGQWHITESLEIGPVTYKQLIFDRCIKMSVRKGYSLQLRVLENIYWVHTLHQILKSTLSRS